MPNIKTVVTACDLVTAYGKGALFCWEGILSSKSAIGKVERFSTVSFQSKNAAVVAGLKYFGDDSLLMQMFISLLKRNKDLIPQDALLILATTTGEIDILEQHVLEGVGDAKESGFSFLLEKVKALTGIMGESAIISSACASSSAALGFASSLIQSGKSDCVLVVAADAVTEFVFSGFSSLMALDPDNAKPFDKNRAGLSLGEGAGFVLLMSQARAQQEGRTILGEIAGWAVSGDANHMTGPSRDGSGLKLAIQKALRSAGVSSDDVGCISSHGTGTVYNDAMEMKAYKSVFENRPVPLYSIKGAVGHTMGASGLIETIIALRVLEKRIIPPTVGLIDVDPEAKDWASRESRALAKSAILLNNAGFGGVNAALVLKQ
ncbi:MAG: beta-ketoacyl synthase N-terminal-like domain-containing protein [Candidatus Omnitrophica bacterium]|nr:beta-ketoacyl synthase N-terminal-like domain-containing protein [Candidatus Omnitrophota bacterium]